MAPGQGRNEQIKAPQWGVRALDPHIDGNPAHVIMYVCGSFVQVYRSYAQH